MDLLLKLRDARSLTVLISLHNLSLAGMYLERLVLLSDGKIFADGTPSEVLRKEMLEEVYRTQLVLLPGGNGTPIVSIEPRH
jgi:iron complex transport system ATP-binding protein